MKPGHYTPRERVVRALTFEAVDRIPIENYFGGELERKCLIDVGSPPYEWSKL